MEVNIVIKNYGKGKRRLILIDKSNNMAFASFGERDKEFTYLESKGEHKKECQLNNVFDRDKHGCKLECIADKYCVHFR
jgi:hypothetical protein